MSCKCIGILTQYGNFLKSYHPKAKFVFNWRSKAKPEGDEIIRKAKEDGRNALLEHEAKQLLRLHGLPVSKDYLANTVDEAVKFAKKIGRDVAMKIVSQDILHKSDAGGVRLGLDTEHDIRDAFDGIMKGAKAYKPDADIKGVIISPMAPKGLEVIIGTKIDDQFGPVIMYGLGGILVEIMRDVAFRVLPVSPVYAKKMIEETKSFAILNGVRGQTPHDKGALRKLLSMCSDIIESYPEIQEMDLNPVIVHEVGVSIVDTRIILK